MKFSYKAILFALFAIVLFVPANKLIAQSGSELIVEWEAEDGTVKVNALRDAIAADTDRPDDRIYVLRKGGFYWFSETIRNDGWHLRIVGEEPDPSDVFGNPAVIQSVAREDGSHPDKLIQASGSVTLKNLYIVGADESGGQGSYQPVQFDANDADYTFDNCIFERSNFAMIAVTGQNNNILVTNCTFRNLIGHPSDQQWQGRAISIWADQESVIVENNSFINIGMTALQIEGGAAKYVRFVHNTIVGLGRSVNTGNWWRDAYFANNLIVNGFWHGEGYADVSAVGRRGYTSGMFGIGALPGKYGPEEGRRVLFTKAATYRDPLFTAFYGDSIRAQPFVSELAVEEYIDIYENMVVNDTMWLDVKPNFASAPDDAEMVNKMIANINALRTVPLPSEVPTYFWRLPADPLDISWPSPENLSYSTPAVLLTAGTDGLPLGDLNWFPDKKAIWEANKEDFVAYIESLAGPVTVFDIVEVKEAEEGTVGGSAEVKNVEGFSYVGMDGGGFFEWIFDLADAGEYELNVWTHMRGNDRRGQRVFVNGVSIHDPMNWGEYIWGGEGNVHASMPLNEWTWTLIKQSEIVEAGALTLPAGENKIRIESSWGYQNFAGIDLILNGAVVKELRVPDLTSHDLVAINVEGAVWTPSALKFVDMGANGSVTLQFDVSEDATYRLNIALQNYNTPQPGTVSVDGTPVVTDLEFPAKADSTGTAVLSGSFPLTAGSHSIAITGSNVNMDVVTLVKETKIVSVRDNELPDGFSLEQNYPNPFNPSTTIKFTLGTASNIKLNIYNILGQKVATLLDAPMAAGTHTVNFNARHLASGVYIYSIEHTDFRVYKKMMLLK